MATLSQHNIFLRIRRFKALILKATAPITKALAPMTSALAPLKRTLSLMLLILVGLSCSDNSEQKISGLDSFNKAEANKKVTHYGQKMSLLGSYSQSQLRRLLDMEKRGESQLKSYGSCNRVQLHINTETRLRFSVEWFKIGCNMGSGRDNFYLEGYEIFDYEYKDSELVKANYQTRNLRIKTSTETYNLQFAGDLEFDPKPAPTLGLMLEMSFKYRQSFFITPESASTSVPATVTETDIVTMTPPKTEAAPAPGTAITAGTEFSTTTETTTGTSAAPSTSHSTKPIAEYPTDYPTAYPIKSPTESPIEPPTVTTFGTTTGNGQTEISLVSESQGYYDPTTEELRLTKLEGQVEYERFRRNSLNRKQYQSHHNLSLQNSRQGFDTGAEPSVLELNLCGILNGHLEYELNYNKKSTQSDFSIHSNETIAYQKTPHSYDQIACRSKEPYFFSSLIRSLNRLLSYQSGLVK